MTTGDIVIVSFPFTDLTSFKARPAVVVNIVKDNFNDVIVCLITSVVPENLRSFQIFIKPGSMNNLKAASIIKVARIATVEQEKIRAVIGKLNQEELKEFKKAFQSLVETI